MHIISSIISVVLLGCVCGVIGTMLMSFRHEIMTALTAAPNPAMASSPDFERAYVSGVIPNREHVSGVCASQPELLALAA
jgi:hypothetical protein